MTIVATGIVAAAFFLIHLFAGRVKLQPMPRSVWLSAAGGISVAYVFVHLLPELAAHQQRFEESDSPAAAVVQALESHTYLIALIGLSLFYGLERMVRRHGRRSEDGNGIFWIHLGSFAVYNLLIGYLLVHREETGLRGLALFAVALGVHFLVNDQGLHQHHGEAYRRGRWILALAPVAGWALGVATELPPLAISGLFAFLAGGVVLNVLKEELPEDRDSRFWAFGAGAAGYAALLLVSA